MKKKYLFFIVLLLLTNVVSVSQTGVGTLSPDLSSKLDVLSNTKGILIPRINLTSLTQDLDALPGQATGLMIFNSGVTFAMGFYYWDGAIWKTIDNKTSIIPEITSLLCSGATLEPASFTASAAYVGILKVPYTGGNGGSYSVGAPIASTGNTGLTLTRKAGTLEFGNGFLTYDVTGTPTSSSPVGASFALSFGTATPQSCVATVGVVSIARRDIIATMGPLLATSDNGRDGFHRMLTTPDGKFSVRVFVHPAVNLDAADIQIRSNNGAQTIMWNNHIGYSGGTIGNASNALVLTSGGIWYGNDGENSNNPLSVVTNINAAWANPDVYFTAPEQRSYMWTTTNVNDQVMYTLKFMMGAPSPTVAGNATNAANVKAFLQIDQVTAGN